MYISPCPILFLPSPLYINPFHDSLHHSMYLFLPSPLYINPYVIHSIILFISLPAPPLPSLSPLCQSLLRFTPSVYVYYSLPPPLPSLSSLYQSLRDSLHHSIYITPCPLLFLPSPLYIYPFHDSLHHSMYISPCPLLFLHSPLYINPFHDSLHRPSLSPIYQSLP